MNYKDYGLIIHDELAVRAIVAYLEMLEPETREDALKRMEQDKDFFASIVGKAVELFQKDYDRYSRVSLYYKYIGKDYLEKLKTVNTEAYLEDVPPGVYKYIRDCFK